MESNKIVVDFAIVDNVVIAKLDEFPKELRGEGFIAAKGDYSIRSVDHCEMTAWSLYLSGCSMRKENLFAYTFPSVDKAKEAVKNWKLLIREYNSYHEKADTLMKESLSIKWERAE